MKFQDVQLHLNPSHFPELYYSRQIYLDLLVTELFIARKIASGEVWPIKIIKHFLELFELNEVDDIAKYCVSVLVYFFNRIL